MNCKYILISILVFSFGCSSVSVKEQTIESTPLENTIELGKKSGYTLKSTNKKIINSVEIADCVIYLNSFKDKVTKIESFSHSEKNGFDVYESLLSDKKAIVSSYYKRFTRAAAYRIPNTETVYINLAKSSTYKSLVISLLHERLHVLEYKHKGNRRAEYDNINSVPYKVSGIAGDFVDECK